MASNIRALKTDVLSWAHDLYDKTHQSTGNSPPFEIDLSKASVDCVLPSFTNIESTEQKRHLIHQDFIYNYSGSNEFVSFEREVEVVESVCIKWDQALCFDKKLQVPLPTGLQTTSISSITLGNGAADEYQTKSKVLVSGQGISMGARERKALQIFADQVVYSAEFKVWIVDGSPNSEPKTKPEENVFAKLGQTVIKGNFREVLLYLANAGFRGYAEESSGAPNFEATGTIEVRKNLKLYGEVGDGQSI